jgi:hypothetical protein
MNARIVSSKEIVRVRIYIRVSTTTGLDQKFNSLDASMRLPVPLSKARLMPAGCRSKPAMMMTASRERLTDRSWRTSGPRTVSLWSARVAVRRVVVMHRRYNTQRETDAGTAVGGFQSDRGALQRRFEASRPAWTDYSSQHGTKTSVSVIPVWVACDEDTLRDS